MTNSDLWQDQPFFAFIEQLYKTISMVYLADQRGENRRRSLSGFTYTLPSQESTFCVAGLAYWCRFSSVYRRCHLCLFTCCRMTSCGFRGMLGLVVPQHLPHLCHSSVTLLSRAACLAPESVVRSGGFRIWNILGGVLIQIIYLSTWFCFIDKLRRCERMVREIKPLWQAKASIH